MKNIEGADGYRPAVEHVNQYIVKCMDEVLKDTFAKNGLIDYKSINPDSETFLDRITKLFPPRFPRERMGQIYLDLYAVLSVPECYCLNLIEEYVVYHLIKESLDRTEKNLLTEEKQEEIKRDLSCTSGVNKSDLHHYLFKIQDVKSYLEIAFEDWDFLLLNDIAADKLDQPDNNNLTKPLGINLDETHKGPSWDTFLKDLEE